MNGKDLIDHIVFLLYAQDIRCTDSSIINRLRQMSYDELVNAVKYWKTQEVSDEANT